MTYSSDSLLIPTRKKWDSKEENRVGPSGLPRYDATRSRLSPLPMRLEKQDNQWMAGEAVE